MGAWEQYIDDAGSRPRSADRALVLEAFDALFNRRDFAAVEGPLVTRVRSTQCRDRAGKSRVEERPSDVRIGSQMRDAGAAGQFRIGDTTINRLGYGAMRITGAGIWGPPSDRAAALATLRRLPELGVTRPGPDRWTPNGRPAYVAAAGLSLTPEEVAQLEAGA